MSENDRKKELNEEKCLDDAIRLAKNKRAMTRNIMNMLSGTTVTRAKNDRSDIIRVWHSNNPNEGDVFVGIEHFMVDQVIKIKKNRIDSVGAEYRSIIQNSYVAGHDALQCGQEIPEKTRDRFVNNVLELSAATGESGYAELMASLKKNLHSHAQRANAYRNEIQNVANGHPIKLAFLIEIRCHFPNLFLNQGRTVCQSRDGLMPMFREVVDELEKVDSSLVDYLVLYIRHTSDRRQKNVIAVKTGNVAKSLRSQATPIYEYCGTNADIQSINVECTKPNSHEYHFKFLATHSDNATEMEPYIPALKAAYAAIHQGKPFATTLNIQSYLYSFGKKVEFSSAPDSNPPFTVHGIDGDEMLRRFDEFTAKYQIGDDFNDKT